MRIHLSRRVVTLALLFAASCFTLASQANAQEVLRWKLQEGQQFDITIEQEIISEQSFQGQIISTDIEMAMNCDWDINQVNDEGIISLTQTINRMRMDMEIPGSPTIHVDTDDEENGGPIASQIKSVIGAFIGVDIHQEMNALGDIVGSSIAEEDLERLANAGNGALGEIFSEDTFEQMLRQSSIVFPEEALSPNDSWENEWEIQSPVGTMGVKGEYTLVGYEEHLGIACAKIEFSMTSELSGDPEGNISLEIRDQESHGTIYFAIEEGRVVSSEWEQSLTMEIATLGQVIPQSINTSAKMTIMPREE